MPARTDTRMFGFHPLVEQWFRSRFPAPTEPQRLGWPAITAGEHTLIAAPTGSGKTLTAFLAVIDRLLRRSLKDKLSDGIRVVYVSPLRALSNDMHRNLEMPLREITELVEEAGIRTTSGEKPDLIRVGLRTGDTSASQRATLVRRPPHILVTTPESLYLLLTSPKGRQALRHAETVIVDEIHALVRDKRGSHLALSLERLQELCDRPLQRIGLSATQRPIERMAEFLVGVRNAENGKRRADVEDKNVAGQLALPFTTSDCETVDDTMTGSESPLSAFRFPLSESSSACTIIDVGHSRQLDLAIEVPTLELSAVCSYEHWANVNARVVELINSHRSTLVFVNTRRMAERVAHQLTELLGEDKVSSHHGSLSAELRLKTERRLKDGGLKAVVATSSLELGIDIGYIDLVIQLGSPGWIATLLQRIGRAGHAVAAIPKGRLFALTRDELLEAMALMRAVKSGRLDVVSIPEAPLDVLAQQIVAEVAAREECSSDRLFAAFQRAYPYRKLTREAFDSVVQFLSEGLTDTSGRARVYLHHDRVKRRLRARPGARIAATCNAGAIPEIGQYRVVADPDRTVVGSVDEDFAVESQRGDIFLLGSTSWRFQGIRGLDVVVTDAGGAPPTIPFWRGEAPGRSWELSEEVSRLREEIESRLTDDATTDLPLPRGEGRGEGALTLTLSQRERGLDGESLVTWLEQETNCDQWAAQQMVNYVAAQKAAIGLVPNQRRVVFERFFDESGGMQVVVHAPFGARVAKAWGLAMRKRFCRSFDFELQATADDDGFILSLGPQHSFPLESLFPMLSRQNARNLLEQAILQIPLFQVRWRWNMNRALLVLRMKDGKKVPPALQRFRADDLLTAVFPRLTGCQENIVGDHELPAHPLIQQTMHDCLTEALDLEGLHRVLDDIEAGRIELIARDTREPSPFCYELLNANPYAFLDGGELQERRARAVANRRSLTVESVQDLGRLDPEAIAQVRREAQPLIRNADELHDVLLSRFVVPVAELMPPLPLGEGWGEGALGQEMSVSKRSRSVTEGLSLARDGESSTPASLTLALSQRERGTVESLQHWFGELVADQRATTVTLPDGRAAWAAAERLPAVRLLYPAATPNPLIEPPPGVRMDWTTVDARIAMLRGWLEICGPTSAEELAMQTTFAESQVFATLEALEGEGVVLRGRFRPTTVSDDCQLPIDNRTLQIADTAIQNLVLSTQYSVPGTHDSVPSTQYPVPSECPDQPVPQSAIKNQKSQIEWCHRRLLARIHRLTIEGLRRLIEPVDVATYWRYVARRQGVLSAERRAGVNGVFEIVSMLQGLDLPAIAWERDILPARVANYRPEWLDELCLGGEVGWGRLYPPRVNPDKSKPIASVTRVVPVSLFLRSDWPWLQSAVETSESEWLSSTASDLADMLRVRGAMFLTDLLCASRLLPAHLEDGLGELVSRGLITADGFAGLRQLIREKDGSAGSIGAGWRRPGLIRQRAPLGSAGRWALSPAWSDAAIGRIANPSEGSAVAKADGLAGRPADKSEIVEQWAWQLLRRWGVVFRDLLARETGAPAWFELLQVYRRLEARGEIRGGRFVAGVAGEQFSMSETIRQLRLLRDNVPLRELILISAADPLNLVGILDEQPRVPSIASHRLVCLDGRCVATQIAEQITFAPGVPAELEPTIRELLEHGQPGEIVSAHRHRADSDSSRLASQTTLPTDKASPRSRVSSERTRSPIAGRPLKSEPRVDTTP